jgi:2-C-methyl-D-erythritol 2,4-cyclodiphosphate synthase
VKARVGMGFDVHPFSDDPGRPLVLAGVTVDGPGLAGHSDADVVAHAVADALLGATALGDLGTLFPASDERYRGASSMGLLDDVVGRVVKTGLWVANVDVVVAAERPVLGPHVPAMVEHLTTVLARAREPMGEPLHVSVKPKRAEGLGTIGRGEGIAAWAVALLERA